MKNEKAAVNPENLWAMTTGASFDGKNNLRNQLAAHIFATDWLPDRKFERYKTGHSAGQAMIRERPIFNNKKQKK